MRILPYNPDNGVTRNFMPHLWMFLPQAIAPPGHEVLLVDGNARAMSEQELVEFAREQGSGLVGIGAMTRMIARAYRMADALRALDCLSRLTEEPEPSRSSLLIKTRRRSRVSSSRSEYAIRQVP